MSQNKDFWSRRRAAVQEEEQQDADATQAEIDAKALAELEQKSDAEILEQLDLPDPDALLPGQDVRAFMAKAVPDRIRRRALRQLWKLNPVLANLDGLVDYGEDYTDAATVIENMQTTYQVGKGMLAHIEAMAKQADAQDADAEDLEDIEEDEDAEDAPGIAEIEDVADIEMPEVAPEIPDGNDQQEPESTTMVATRPRRMRFEIGT